jgi:HAD superfamily phosphoserine phosphatase-like hydrolase
VKIEIAEAKRQLSLISEKLQSPFMLIGGLAVNQYVPTRNTQDIDLICDHNTLRDFLGELYPTNDWIMDDKNEDEYRPCYHVTHRHKEDYPIIKFGPKLIERDAYQSLPWESLKKRSRPFRYSKLVLDNILVPSPESLVYTKMVSFIGRDITSLIKIQQDLSDIRDLINNDDFRLVMLNDLIEKNVEDQKEFKNQFKSRLVDINGSLKGCCLINIAELFVPNTFNISRETGIIKKGIVSNESKPSKYLVAFDLDGTLIKGIRHSWTLVWNHLNIRNQSQKDRKLDFVNRRLSYLEWCKLDAEALRENGLNLTHFKEIADSKKCKLTQNLEEAIIKLKEKGIKTAIISGGIDSLLYAMLPNADDLFDDILINRFVYDKQGMFESINPTEYDWDGSKLGVVGKGRGLERLCEKYGISISDSAFVGDDINDQQAMEIAGKKILYCGEDLRRDYEDGLPKGIEVITKNDLNLVVRSLFRKFGLETLPQYS